MKAKASLLSHHVSTFFRGYLAAQRNVSPHTMQSYRDALKLFFLFAAERLRKKLVLLDLPDFSVELVLGFLEHLEKARKNGVATRNVRLAALHVFFRHIAAQAPEHLEICQRIQGIPFKRGPRPTVRYLEATEMDALLKAIDRSTFDGRRDYALLALTYQTGARVQEIISLRASDLQLDTQAHVRIWGKGRKERIVPLWPQTAAIVRKWLAEREIDPRSSAPVFVNRDGNPLTRWGVRYILKKYATAAKASCPSIAKKRIHPHVLRHTAAVHMLISGVDPTGIRDILGHASAETTWRYARLNLEMKRKAIETCAINGPKVCATSPARWRRDADLLAELEAIGKRAAARPASNKGGSIYGE
jgi:site-specific recombinase XerD